METSILNTCIFHNMVKSLFILMINYLFRPIMQTFDDRRLKVKLPEIQLADPHNPSIIRGAIFFVAGPLRGGVKGWSLCTKHKPFFKIFSFNAFRKNISLLEL